MAKNSELTLMQKRSIAVATLVCILFGLWFLRSFFILIVLAAILAYLFSPIHRWLQTKKFSKGGATAVTLIICVCMVLIPLTFIAIFATAQLRSMATDIASFMRDLDINEALSQIVEAINRLLERVPFGDFSVSEQGVLDWVTNSLQSIGSFLVDSLASVAGSIGAMVTSLIIYIYLFVSFLNKGPQLVETFRQLNPLGPKVSDIYIRRSAAMVRGTVQGQFIIALVQGFLSAATFALVGYSNLFFVLFIIFTLFSIIPLGAGILTIPMGILIALTGNVVPGAIIVLQHLLISTNIDNVLRPILVPKEARLDAALMLVSVFAGLRIFGFPGIVIGPTIMILIVTTVQVFLEVYRGYPATGDEKLLKD